MENVFVLIDTMQWNNEIQKSTIQRKRDIKYNRVFHEHTKQANRYSVIKVSTKQRGINEGARGGGGGGKAWTTMAYQTSLHYKIKYFRKENKIKEYIQFQGRQPCNQGQPLTVHHGDHR